MANEWSLLADTPSQAYISISVIPAGSLYLADKEVFQDCVHQGSDGLSGTGRRVPSFSFLLQHEKHGRLLFDLGLRKVRLFLDQFVHSNELPWLERSRLSSQYTK